MATVNYKNIDIHYTSTGDGNVVVLLHGFLENLTMWDQISPKLSKNYQVVCIDLLGHGKTGSLGYSHTMEMQAEVIANVIHELKLTECVLIGHSMGGYVALTFAELNPRFIKGLCLMNSTALPDTNEKKINRDRGIAAVKYNPEIFVRMAIPNLFSEENKTIFPLEIKQSTDEALKISQQGIIAAMEGMKIRKDRTKLYQTLHIPMQMIIGKQDPALDYNSLISQTKNTKVEVVEFPDGHMSHIENKIDLANTLKRFVIGCYS